MIEHAEVNLYILYNPEYMYSKVKGTSAPIELVYIIVYDCCSYSNYSGY